MITREEFRERLLPIGLAQVVGLLLGLLGIRLVSHLVAPADFGRYGVFTSLAPVGMWVLFGGINAALSRLWMPAPDRPGLLQAVLRATGRRLGWLALACAGLAFIAGGESSPGFAVLLLATALALGVGQYFRTALQAERRHWPDFGLSAIDSVSRTALPPLLYLLLGGGALALMAGFTLHALLGLLGGAWLLRAHLRAPVAQATTLPATFLGAPFLLLAIAGWTIGGLNRWLVAGLFGSETAGYFTLAANVAVILPSMLGTILVQWQQPLWFAAAGGDTGALARRVDRAALGYTAAGLGLTGALHLLLPHLVGPLVSARYEPALAWALGAGCFTVAVTTGRFYSTLLVAARREQAAPPVELTAAAAYGLGCLAAAWAGPEWFQRWLVLTPLVPWLINRPLARRALRATA